MLYVWQLPRAQYHPSHPPHRAVSPHHGCHPKSKFILFQHQVFLKLITWDSFPPRVFQCKEGEWRDGSGWAVPEWDAANPVFALFMSPLRLYWLHFKYFSFLTYLHILLFSFKLSGRAQVGIWDTQLLLGQNCMYFLFLRYFRPTLKGMTCIEGTRQTLKYSC